MPVTVTERFKSRTGSRGENGRRELLYTLEGSDDDVELLDALRDAAPTTHDGLVRDSIELIEQLDNGVWEASAKYVRPDLRLEPGEDETLISEFSTIGGTQHIIQSRETMSRHSDLVLGGGVTNHKGAIGVRDGEPAGCDIVVPVMEFSVPREFNKVTNAMVAKWFRITGRTNNAPFLGFDTGELLFLGVSGSKRATGGWSVGFKFAASPNAEDLQIGNITVSIKKGWEYLWVSNRKEFDENGNQIAAPPCEAHVERVYDADDFDDLGIT
jgi:hypothetical protein